MLRIIREAIWLGLGVQFCCACQIPAPPKEPAAPKCNTSADCNVRGTKALETKRFRDADSFFQQELQLAEDEGDDSAVLMALNNLAVSRMHQRDLLMARAWVGRALRLDAANPAAIHNLRVIEASQQSFRWPSSPNGTYLQYVACGYWDEIRISDATTTHANLAFSGLRTGTHSCAAAEPSVGDLEGQVLLKGKSAIYKGRAETGPCQIDIEFHGGGLSVQQKGDCGFGHGVYAAGDYERVSTR